MKEMNNNESRNQHVDTFTKNRLMIFVQATSYTLGMIAVLGGAGYLLDQKFSTSPTIFIIGLALAYPFAQLILFKKMKKLGKSELTEVNSKKV